LLIVLNVICSQRVDQSTNVQSASCESDLIRPQIDLVCQQIITTWVCYGKVKGLC